MVSQKEPTIVRCQQYSSNKRDAIGYNDSQLDFFVQIFFLSCNL